MLYKTSLSASFITRYLNRVTYRTQADKFHKLMKATRIQNVWRLLEK